MPGKLIDLASRRPVPTTEPAIGRLPLVVQSRPDGVVLTLPGYEFWLTPGQARELARDLWLGAEDASTPSSEGPRPRGA